MKPHTIIVHLPAGTRLDEDGVQFSEPHEDGSMLAIFKTANGLLRHRYPEMHPGVTVFPHHFSHIPLSDAHLALLHRYGVVSGDLMENALLKISDHHKHFIFHPHSI